MKKIAILVMLIANVHADVNGAVDNFFSSITSDVNVPTMVQNQSAGVISGGGFATRSQDVNLQPMTFTPPSFNGSCGNINFYSGSLSFMTNTDQLIQFMQNTLMTAGITAVITALKAATPNIAGTLESMLKDAQDMLGMFNSSCQLGTAMGNLAGTAMGKRLETTTSNSINNSSDMSGSFINNTVNGSGGRTITNSMSEVASKYKAWVNANANPNTTSTDANVQEFAKTYGSVIWKGMQQLSKYKLMGATNTKDDTKNIANLVISLTGDLIIYSPTDDGISPTPKIIPPSITNLKQFMTSDTSTEKTYNCTYFETTTPGECTGVVTDLYSIDYAGTATSYTGGIAKKIQTAINDIQAHFVSGTPLNNDDLLIISISPMPIFAMAQALDDIGMAGSISSFLTIYKKEISFQIIQALISNAVMYANMAASVKVNNETAQSIQIFVNRITATQQEINSYASEFKGADPVEIMQKVNFLRSYAQNLMSPMILQKVNFAKQMGNY